VLHEHLRQFVNSVVNEHVIRAGDRRRAMGNVVDGRTHRRRSALHDHPCDCRRRRELTGEALHENCSDRWRLYIIRQTIDGLGFQTFPTAHLSSIGERRKVTRLTPSFFGTT